jgi:hypothetical protein
MRHYTHAIAVMKNGRWGVLSWHGSEAAARTALAPRWREVYPEHAVVGVSHRIGHWAATF